MTIDTVGTPAPPDAAGDGLHGLHALVPALADALRSRGLRLATAESCTGGLIAAACTDIAGSSDWFERGVVSYSNQAKQELLGVADTLLDMHGAVSEPVALAMARGLLARAPVDLAVAVTGVAGPGGGSPAKPVGLVWLAWAWRHADGEVQARSQRCQFSGDRYAVRQATVDAALQGLLDGLAAWPGPADPATPAQPAGTR